MSRFDLMFFGVFSIALFVIPVPAHACPPDCVQCGSYCCAKNA